MSERIVVSLFNLPHSQVPKRELLLGNMGLRKVTILSFES